MEIPVSALVGAASGPPTCEVIVINKPAAHLIEVGIFYEITIIRTSMVYGGHLLGHVRCSGQLTRVCPYLQLFSFNFNLSLNKYFIQTNIIPSFVCQSNQIGEWDSINSLNKKPP